MSKERLQKVLARAGVASRRAAEELITEGRIRVNGRIVRELGTRVDHRDKVELDGRRIVAEKPAYYVLNKPRATVTTLSDPEGRPTVQTLLRRVPERVFPVGRLDYHTSGALLLTNDGSLADALLRPRAKVPKVYVAKVQGHIAEEHLGALRQGVVLDDGYETRPTETFVLREEAGHTWLQLTLVEGKNRQIHRMLEALGYRVQRLSRTAFAEISTEGLRPGELRPLRQREIDRLEQKYLKGPATKAGPQRAEESEPRGQRHHDGPHPEERDEGGWRRPQRKTAQRKTAARSTAQRPGEGRARPQPGRPRPGERSDDAPRRGKPAPSRPRRDERSDEDRPRRSKPSQKGARRHEPGEGTPKRSKPGKHSARKGKPKKGAPSTGRSPQGDGPRGKPARKKLGAGAGKKSQHQGAARKSKPKKPSSSQTGSSSARGAKGKKPRR